MPLCPVASLSSAPLSHCHTVSRSLYLPHCPTFTASITIDSLPQCPTVPLAHCTTASLPLWLMFPLSFSPTSLLRSHYLPSSLPHCSIVPLSCFLTPSLLPCSSALLTHCLTPAHSAQPCYALLPHSSALLCRLIALLSHFSQLYSTVLYSLNTSPQPTLNAI